MEFRNLITFSEIAHLKSFTKAAEELGYAQSTITTQIKLLEEELGIKLFEKIGRKIHLTSKGKILLKYAENIISLTEEAREAVGGIDFPHGILRIGIVESLCTMRLPEMLKNYHMKYPEVEIIIKVGVCSDLRSMLKNNIVDLAFILDKPTVDPDLICCVSYNEPMIFLSSPVNGLAGKNQITIEDIKDEPLIVTEKGCSYRNIFEKMFQKSGLKPNIALEVGSIEAIKSFTMSNLGITLLPVMTVEKELESGQLVGFDLDGCKFNMATQILYHKNKCVTAAMKAFISEAKS
ncbi:MAG TPA: LysR family transcriptional regulator [Clostridium sp.]|jgi:DNA-binding transcriptional LysR family regulator|uniref:LysR family transcriptional regulator n=1 Tax=Clostridium lapidicellarium TaxID=3240931 RepID=A0ABV4E0R0_9CLOT|nr:LysR family transcriptional regulator [uncultured Clostridium sp.]NLU09015.1 LysR family transcriptional regulator [Clostridiales bacterium]HBC97471.1 LysR family transcriptional regulator [Clostridium sp.]